MEHLNYFRQEYPLLFVLAEKEISSVISGAITTAEVKGYFSLKISIVFGDGYTLYHKNHHEELNRFLADSIVPFKTTVGKK